MSRWTWLWAAVAAVVTVGAAAQTTRGLTISKAPATRPATTSPARSVDYSWVAPRVEAIESAIGELAGLRYAGSSGQQRLKPRLDEVLASITELEQALRRYRIDTQAGADKDPKAAGAAMRKSFTQQEPVYLCQVALLAVRARLAAAGSLSDGDEQRKQWLQQARQECKAIRLDYRQLTLGLMSHICEAQADRMLGDAKAAEGALEPILKAKLPAGDKAALELRRMARLEKLELSLAAGALKASDEIRSLRKAPEFEPASAQAMLDWAATRALLARLGGQAAAGKPLDTALTKQAAELVRSPAVASVTSPAQRLEALSRLDGWMGNQLLQRDELLQLARQQATLDARLGLELYRRAIGEDWHVPLEHVLACAALAWKEQDYSLAADACAAALASLGADDPRGPALLQMRAAALLKLRRDTDPADKTTRLLTALEAVIESRLDSPVRLDALRTWVNLHSIACDAAEVRRMLVQQGALFKTDAALLYSRAVAAWTLVADADTTTQSTQPAQSPLREVLDDCIAAAAAARVAKDTAVLARAKLLEARVQLATGDGRACLQTLTDARADLQQDKDVAPEAAWLRAQVMLELGMVQAAAKEIEPLANTPGMKVDVLLGLAGALAQRYESSGANRDAIREQVVRLANQAMTAAATDKANFLAVRIRCIDAMLQAHAAKDALDVLGQLLKETTTSDASVQLRVRMAMASALRQQGKDAQALEYLDALAKDFPKDSQVQFARGQCLITLNQGEKALEALRSARALAKAGTAQWCEITLELAAALKAGGSQQAALDILRVSQALYPDFGTPQLRSRLRQAMGENKGKSE